MVFTASAYLHFDVLAVSSYLEVVAGIVKSWSDADVYVNIIINAPLVLVLSCCSPLLVSPVYRDTGHTQNNPRSSPGQCTYILSCTSPFFLGTYVCEVPGLMASVGEIYHSQVCQCLVFDMWSLVSIGFHTKVQTLGCSTDAR
ncbi:hypothetical protein SERLADRAFT_491499 [Serpula lacrymans var. lacrymans S7.9]|uniref:Uncharacterized protein n=1 Tax=Serpula lacrymans var. lacrymans (strain S7.9) TaxID=578457 RepID=F8NR54_SERL9|nr:uncharacterized protein SERLADRAFT_491499 [Serpula lacrymans var. lacrymans S7.9]EGO27030.1 hypothetical protein SERLADRAFT_491499 [Serpula lacrymans var. lacrymans S7.9]